MDKLSVISPAGVQVVEQGTIAPRLPDLAGTTVGEIWDEIIGGLTKPETAKSAATSRARNPGDILFRGTLEEVNRFFSDQEWTDGLPVFAPTLKRVGEFLASRTGQKREMA